MKYLHYFDKDSEFRNKYYTDEYEEPWVSLTKSAPSSANTGVTTACTDNEGNRYELVGYCNDNNNLRYVYISAEEEEVTSIVEDGLDYSWKITIGGVEYGCNNNSLSREMYSDSGCTNSVGFVSNQNEVLKNGGFDHIVLSTKQTIEVGDRVIVTYKYCYVNGHGEFVDEPIKEGDTCVYAYNEELFNYVLTRCVSVEYENGEETVVNRVNYNKKKPRIVIPPDNKIYYNFSKESLDTYKTHHSGNEMTEQQKLEVFNSSNPYGSLYRTSSYYDSSLKLYVAEFNGPITSTTEYRWNGQHGNQHPFDYITELYYPNALSNFDGTFPSGIESIVIGSGLTTVGYSEGFGKSFYLKSLYIGSSAAPQTSEGWDGDGFRTSFGTFDYLNNICGSRTIGNNGLYVPSGATGYDQSHWASELLNPELCDFVIHEL